MDMTAGEHVSDSSRDDSDEEAVLQVYDHNGRVNKKLIAWTSGLTLPQGGLYMIDEPPQGFD